MEHMLADIKRAIYEDGEISDDEVALLSDVLRRYGTTEQTLGVLLDLNSILSGMNHPESFNQLFIGTISAFVLGEDQIISEQKWEWLRDNLLKDDVIDELERRLLDDIATKAHQMPAAMSAFIVPALGKAS